MRQRMESPRETAKGVPPLSVQRKIARVYSRVLAQVGLQGEEEPLISAEQKLCAITQTTVLSLRWDTAVDERGPSKLLSRWRSCASRDEAESNAAGLLLAEATDERFATAVRKLIARNSYALLTGGGELFRARRTSSYSEPCDDCEHGKRKCSCGGRGQRARNIREFLPCPHPLCNKGRIECMKNSLTAKMVDIDPFYPAPSGGSWYRTTRVHPRCSGSGMISRSVPNPNYCPDCEGRHEIVCVSCDGSGYITTSYRAMLSYSVRNETTVQNRPSVGLPFEFRIDDEQRYDPKSIAITVPPPRFAVIVQCEYSVPYWEGRIQHGSHTPRFVMYRGAVRFSPFLDDRIRGLAHDHDARAEGRRTRFGRMLRTRVERRISLSVGRSITKRAETLLRSFHGGVTFESLVQLIASVLAARKNFLHR